MYAHSCALRACAHVRKNESEPRPPRTLLKPRARPLQTPVVASACWIEPPGKLLAALPKERFAACYPRLLKINDTTAIPLRLPETVSTAGAGGCPGWGRGGLAPRACERQASSRAPPPRRITRWSRAHRSGIYGQATQACRAPLSALFLHPSRSPASAPVGQLIRQTFHPVILGFCREKT